ncbi:MAG TPA: hypothetical protein VFU22_18535 [Roseiflexaceae bacterium]|nr:hypothetical protein [Roseiflexaceae bacterium]
MFGIARGVRTLRRWRAAPPERAIWREVVLPLAWHALVALLFLVALPATLLGGSLSMAIFSAPDVGYTLMVVGGVALGWSLVRTAVALRLLSRPAVVAGLVRPAHS